MNEFDPSQLYYYTAEQMAAFIMAGAVSKEELYANGYPATKRPELEEILERLQRLPIEDVEMWQWAQRRDTVEAYQQYLNKYDVYGDGTYRGKYVFDAQQRKDELVEVGNKLREELFEAMHTSPWLFRAETVEALVRGITDPSALEFLRKQTDVASRFICTGQTITFEEIKERGIVPYDWTIEKILAPDVDVIQTNIDQLGDFPVEDRTDVYFLGVPRGGKSSVLAGIFYEMYSRGQLSYVPQFNKEGKDPGSLYYRGLINAVYGAKFPASTSTDTISFMKINLKSHEHENPLTFVEIAGEAFRIIAEGHINGASVWQSLGAAQCLKSRNRKLLAFIVDYSISKHGVRTDSDVWNDMQQAMTLDSALTVLGHDGTGRDYTVGCTLSKVDTIAVIVTKSDLIGDNLTPEQKNQAAVEYLSARFQNFMNNLSQVCQKHGINRPINYKPYVMTFSLGKLLIGNTYQYDPTEVANIIEFISTATAHKKGGNSWFKSIFG